MSQILSAVSDNPLRQRLRSSDDTIYDTPRTNTKSGDERMNSREWPVALEQSAN